MRRAALLLLVVLLLVPAVTIAAPDGSSSTDSNADLAASTAGVADSHAGIGVLTLDQSGNARLVNGSLDLGRTLAIDRAGARIRLERYEFSARTNDSGTGESAAMSAMAVIENQSLDLFREERAYWQRYANGTIDEPTLLGRLAETQVSASELNRFHEQIATMQGVQFYQTRSPYLTALNGPVRSSVVAAMHGEYSGPIYVESSSDGLVLATIANGQYVRETYRPDRQSMPPEQLEDAQPWGLAPVLQDRYGLSDPSRSALQGLNDDTFFRYTFEFDGGSIRAYLDGGTEEVFYEEQTRDLDRFSGGPSVSATDNGTRLVVNRSYAGGPLRIATYDNETGIPISSTVVVDGKRLDTGSDYVMWTLTPPGEEINVTAIRPRGRVTVSLSPLEPDGIDDP